MGLVDLFYGVAKEHGGLVTKSTFPDRLSSLEKENQRLKNEMINHERFEKFRS
jgi:hypothetical protein